MLEVPPTQHESGDLFSAVTVSAPASGTDKPITMVVIRLPDGSTEDYQLCQTPEGLRLVGRGASYALTAMLSDAGWRIVGIRSESAKRLLRVAGLLTDSVAILPRRTRWRTSLGRPSERR